MPPRHTGGYGVVFSKYMDLPRYCGGKRRHKRSPSPSFVSLQNSPAKVLAPKIRALAQSLAREKLAKGLKVKNLKQPKRIPLPSEPCTRRALECMGLDHCGFNFIEPPHLFSPHKHAYEIRTGLIPLLTVSDAREAELICIALRAYGFPQSHFVQVEVPQNKPIRQV